MRYSLTLLMLVLASPLAAAEPDARKAEKGTFRFEPVDDQKDVPERYRLEARDFAYELEFDKALPSAKIDRYKLRFPSPVETDCKENNTVHAEYYKPRGKDKFPCVIVLDITAGNQDLSRTICTVLAQNGIGGLFVQMAYYGPRRPPGSRRRLLSPDIPQAMDAVRQTVLDLRCAAAWMAARPEIDKKQLGIMGTSLGSFMAALTAEMEPRLGRCAVLLGGGNLVANYYHDPRGVMIRRAWEYFGGTMESLQEAIAPADPITCAANLKSRKLLIIAAKKDEIVPPKAAEDLYEASGKQKLIWYDCGHYTAAFYFVPAMKHIVEHFGK
ncbi:MAG: alpha/beta hydrolase family protein [Gemmataceae bacterium]